MVDDESICTILSAFTACDVTITEFLTYLLQDSQHQNHRLVLEIIDNACNGCTPTPITPIYTKSLRDLARKLSDNSRNIYLRCNLHLD